AELVERRCSFRERAEDGGGRRVVGDDGGRSHLEAERLEPVVRGRRGRGTEPKERVRPSAQGGRDLARNRQHLPPVLEREVRRDQGARPLAAPADYGPPA